MLCSRNLFVSATVCSLMQSQKQMWNHRTSVKMLVHVQAGGGGGASGGVELMMEVVFLGVSASWLPRPRLDRPTLGSARLGSAVGGLIDGPPDVGRLIGGPAS